jgi:hypothetical protein
MARSSYDNTDLSSSFWGVGHPNSEYMDEDDNTSSVASSSQRVQQQQQQQGSLSRKQSWTDRKAQAMQSWQQLDLGSTPSMPAFPPTPVGEIKRARTLDGSLAGLDSDALTGWGFMSQQQSASEGFFDWANLGAGLGATNVEGVDPMLSQFLLSISPDAKVARGRQQSFPVKVSTSKKASTSSAADKGEKQEKKKRETLEDIARRVPLSAMRQHFNVPLRVAAANLNVSVTTLKRLCRRNGVARWPHRQINGLDRAIGQLESRLHDCVHNPPAEGEDSVEDMRQQLEELVLRRSSVINQESLSDDGSFADIAGDDGEISASPSPPRKRSTSPKRSLSEMKGNRVTSPPPSTTSLAENDIAVDMESLDIGFSYDPALLDDWIIWGDMGSDVGLGC